MMQYNQTSVNYKKLTDFREVIGRIVRELLALETAFADVTVYAQGELVDTNTINDYIYVNVPYEKNLSIFTCSEGQLTSFDIYADLGISLNLNEKSIVDMDALVAYLYTGLCFNYFEYSTDLETGEKPYKSNLTVNKLLGTEKSSVSFNKTAGNTSQELLLNFLIKIKI